MQQSGIGTAEQERMTAVHRLVLLDTEPEPEFDEVVQLAAAICGTPISGFSLLDTDRQWLKAFVGVGTRSFSRDIAFCDYTIRQRDLMLVEDARLDARFAQNPLVTEAGIRFYAGMPVTDPAGFAVGALCVIDHTPRTLTQEQQNTLRVLASQVAARLELRIKRRELEQALVEAQAATARMTASERRFQAFMDSGPFMAYLKDAEGRLLYYNEKVASHFRVSRTALLNKTDAELWSRELAQLYRAHDLDILSSGQLRVVDEQTFNPDGSLSTWRSFKFPCTDANGSALLGGISLDVTAELQRETDLKRSQDELEIANCQLRELASVDALTGLANRRTFDEEFARSFRRARRVNAPLCVLMLDVDRFKSHNDRFGHMHGDQVLRELAFIIEKQLRTGDLLARYGGEEFVILLAETEEANARLLADRLLEAIRRHPWDVAPVTVSIGLGALTPATHDTNHLLTLADEALYAAKCGGRDRAIAYPDIYNHTLQMARDTQLQHQRSGA